MEDLPRDDLVKLVAEKEELLMLQTKEYDTVKDEFLRSYAEIENVMERTKREAENNNKAFNPKQVGLTRSRELNFFFAIQSFGKGLLDVGDNLVRASSVVKASFAKIDTSEDASGAVPLLKTLLEGVEMTKKQLAEVFKMYGVEKYDPLDEQFDPNKHHALFQIPDGSKPAGVVAAVLKYFTKLRRYCKLLEPLHSESEADLVKSAR